jgi:hypothetical protein
MPDVIITLRGQNQIHIVVSGTTYELTMANNGLGIRVLDGRLSIRPLEPNMIELIGQKTGKE